MIQNGTPVGEKVYTSYPYGRPSLNFFYSDRQVIPAATSELQHHWQQNPQPYFLLDKSTWKSDAGLGAAGWSNRRLDADNKEELGNLTFKSKIT